MAWFDSRATSLATEGDGQGKTGKRRKVEPKKGTHQKGRQANATRWNQNRVHTKKDDSQTQGGGTKQVHIKNRFEGNGEPTHATKNGAEKKKQR